MAIMYTDIPAGTRLYRTCINAKITTHKCTDTGKTGIYFSKNPMIPVGMIPECLEKRILIEVVVTKSFKVALWKYSYRELNPSRYFDKKNKLKLNIFPSPDENISHIHYKIAPLKRNKYSDKIENYEENIFGGDEVFVSSKDNPGEILKIINVYDFVISPEKVEDFLKKIKFSTNLEDYLPILEKR